MNGKGEGMKNEKSYNKILSNENEEIRSRRNVTKEDRFLESFTCYEYGLLRCQNIYIIGCTKENVWCLLR